MANINGIHHISMKASNEKEYTKVIRFYKDILELAVAIEWKGGIMFKIGSGFIEIFDNGDGKAEKGIIRHFALETDDVDECVKRVREAGYEVFVEPNDIVIPSNPPYAARMAFCHGPLGEEIEFFQPKD